MWMIITLSIVFVFPFYFLYKIFHDDDKDKK